MTFKILCLVLFRFGAFFVIVSSLNYYLYFMVGASGCTEEPDIRDELRFFGQFLHGSRSLLLEILAVLV